MLIYQSQKQYENLIYLCGLPGQHTDCQCTDLPVSHGRQHGLSLSHSGHREGQNGQLIALSDLRPCGGDIGYGRVDILSRVSTDNGASWSEAVPVLQGSGKGADAGYGDACLVADRDRNELLLVCVSGDVPYWQSSPEHRQRMVATHARYNKKNGKWEWSPLPPYDLTKQVYEDIFDGRIRGLFMGSGRICQSRMVKVGNIIASMVRSVPIVVIS